MADSSATMGGVPTYLLVLAVVVPIVVICLVVFLLYVCCTRKYKLNWFEQGLLNSQSGDSEKTYLNTGQYSNIKIGSGSTQVIHKYVGLNRCDSTTSMGSASSSPTESEPPPAPSPNYMFGSAHEGSEVDESEETDTFDEDHFRRKSSLGLQTVMDVVPKKRAQSLVPQLGLFPGRDSNKGGSPNKTPPNSSSLQEMVFSYPPEKLTETVAQVQMPSGYQRRRRASMQDALDHTKINTRLYEEVSAPQESPIASIQEENLGSLNIALSYHADQSLLTVRVIQARDLVSRDFSGSADPYCRVTLLPNRKLSLMSNKHKKTLNPEFEEEFVFECSNIHDRTLEILVFDFDQFSRDECLGQVLLPLEHIDLSEKVVLWKGISMYEKDKEEKEDLGDVMFSLAYLPSAERLTVAVVKARRLRPTGENKEKANPFVKVALLAGGKRIKKKKTSTKRGTLGPIWNEALVFDVSKELFKTLQIELIVFSDSLIGNNEGLGRVVIGPEATGDEFAHWNDLINSKNAMARWHHMLPVSNNGNN